MNAKDYTELYFFAKGISFIEKLHEDASKEIKTLRHNYSYFVVKKIRINATIIYWEIFGTNNLGEISKVLQKEYNHVELIYELTHEEDGVHVHKMNKTDLT